MQCVVGLDEAGRGPLAGPVVAGAVMVWQSARQRTKITIQIPNVNDSKKLSEKKREELYEILTKHPLIIWGVGVVSEKIIDKINILEATKMAMRKAVEDLKLIGVGHLDYRCPTPVVPTPVVPDFLLIDGNFRINGKIAQKSIIKGDQKVFSIAAASIIAKVTRDRFMQTIHRKYPKYGFNLHKGYPTALHLNNLEKFGLCKIHRKTFNYKGKLFTA